MLALSFMAVWFPWLGLPPGLRFVACLCLYDGFLTWIDISHSALLVDLAVSERERSDMSLYSSIFSGFGSLTVFSSFVFWDRANVGPFQAFCAVIAAISAAGFWFSARFLKKWYMISKKADNMEVVEPPPAFSATAKLPWQQYLRQSWRNSNLLYFSLLSLVQV